MANKYIIEGATYCGDGTASNEAASAGAAGAWNNINVLEGAAPAYGTLAAGDVVYIRSKTSAGADITRTLAANVTLGSANATATNWISWILDDGTTWLGINGSLTYECPSTYTCTVINYNEYIGLAVDKFVIKETNTSVSGKKTFNFSPFHKSQNLFVDLSINTHVYGSVVASVGNGSIFARGFHAKFAKFGTNPALRFSDEMYATFVSPNIEMTQIETAQGLFYIGNYGAKVVLIGGKIHGSGATTGSIVFSIGANVNGATVIGTKIPKTMTFTVYGSRTYRVDAIGLDGGVGAQSAELWGDIDSRADNYPPTLDAYTEFSTQRPWSWRIYPKNAGLTQPFYIPVLKLFTGESSIKTVALNVLIADSVTGANRGTLWLDVCYTDDSTGDVKTCTTYIKDTTDIDTSSANWSTTSWGSINLVKRVLSVTTPTAIKQDTAISATLCGTWKAASALDIMFVCPDVALT